MRYVVNTHYHGDHSTGTCFFNGARVIGHALCRELLDARGRESLERSKAASGELRDVELVLPDVTFNSGMTLHLGNKTLQFWHSPGHSPDSIVCYVEEDQVLFAADTLMPVPHFVDGDYGDFLASLEYLNELTFENIVQGHGEIVLRGEVREKIESDIAYLRSVRDAVERAALSADFRQALDTIDVESCGKSRILLNGMVQQLHQQNVAALANQLYGPPEPEPEPEPEYQNQNEQP